MVGLAQDRRCAVKIYPGMPAAEKKRGAEGEFLAKDLSIWRQPPGPEADAGSGSRIQDISYFCFEASDVSPLGVDTAGTEST